ncbi:hypothetical protein KM043_011112 [Ampulex compressa]|nr:hypothetical protein KM043_011112 [Ampulex compressa]
MHKEALKVSSAGSDGAKKIDFISRRAGQGPRSPIAGAMAASLCNGGSFKSDRNYQRAHNVSGSIKIRTVQIKLSLRPMPDRDYLLVRIALCAPRRCDRGTRNVDA